MDSGGCFYALVINIISLLEINKVDLLIHSFVSKEATSEQAEKSTRASHHTQPLWDKQTQLQKGVPSSAFTGECVLLRVVGGGYDTIPVQHIYLRSDLVSHHVKVAEVETLPSDATDLVLGNDVAGKKVVPGESEQSLDSPELSQFEEEHPEVFTACCYMSSEQACSTNACWSP